MDEKDDNADVEENATSLMAFDYAIDVTDCPWREIPRPQLLRPPEAHCMARGAMAKTFESLPCACGAANT
ncbi:hypothetical protein H5410_062673 [Solanum commersonii]|uniref:Uncharacterized protein n=1 Tax=Solanum commersonii TaxID=4109 RepID=A0A9J5WB13_SOLCO|nr:hypothetical protein H5410_062673 [Solanum commersonii]